MLTVAFTLPPGIPLSMLLRISRWSIMQKVPYTSHYECTCLWARHFRFFFTPRCGFFSPFPHGTCSLSVRVGCKLRGWFPVLPTTMSLYFSLLHMQGIQYTYLLDTGLSPSLAPYSKGFFQKLYWRRCLRRFHSPLLPTSRLIFCMRYWDDSLLSFLSPSLL